MILGLRAEAHMTKWSLDQEYTRDYRSHRTRGFKKNQAASFVS